jgi:hypothetical protein
MAGRVCDRSLPAVRSGVRPIEQADQHEIQWRARAYQSHTVYYRQVINRTPCIIDKSICLVDVLQATITAWGFSTATALYVVSLLVFLWLD